MKYSKDTDNEDGLTFHCDKCSKVYLKPNQLSKHRLEEHMLRRLICSICKATSKNHYYFGQHLYFVHYYEGKGYHGCKICGTHLRHKSALEKHMLIHKQEKPHMCSKCGRNFTLAGTLKQHEETHMTEADKTLTCHICGKKYGLKRSYQLHVSSHKKIHQCAHCGLRFARREHMKRHIQTQHSSEEIAAIAREKARIHSRNRKSKDKSVSKMGESKLCTGPSNDNLSLSSNELVQSKSRPNISAVKPDSIAMKPELSIIPPDSTVTSLEFHHIRPHLIEAKPGVDLDGARGHNPQEYAIETMNWTTTFAANDNGNPRYSKL
ncbi:unnamed protein product [Owenia fusiformis]|uniref:Uncharacterized protein n=1 Tax=Owenia fusiformis TaxID=6347 RepID=A0A8J1XV05_OWEFU|nr:unnamed protein product [Owenia fusiformis]